MISFSIVSTFWNIFPMLGISSPSTCNPSALNGEGSHWAKKICVVRFTSMEPKMRHIIQVNVTICEISAENFL